MILQTTQVTEVQDIIRTHAKLLPRGGGTKSALSTPKADQTTLDISALTGVLEYDPGEFVFVARAGTKLSLVAKLLAQHGQYLPFDPPFVEAGATLGGTVAAGLSGSMRQRYGGVRDFILGVKFVDGRGNLVQGGAKVVKNAAGFDLPKMMVGSLGQLGVMVELAFKVFPFPKATATIEFRFSNLNEALEALYKLAASHFEFYALDLVPPSTLIVRIGGFAEALPTRLKNLQDFLSQTNAQPIENEPQYWRNLNDLNNLGDAVHVVKVALTPKHIPELETKLHNLPRRYLSAGNLLYVATRDTANLDSTLKSRGLSGLVLTGTVDSPQIGVRSEQVFGQRVTLALDPQMKFS